MATTPPSTPPADGPRRATLRARTPTNPVRPEVIDALDELERSLGDVARWEQLLTGKEGGPEWQRPDDAPSAPRPRHLGPGHFAAPTEDEDVDMEVVISDLHEAIRDLDDRIDEIRPEAPRDVGSIRFDEPDADDLAVVEAGYELGQIPTSAEPRVEPVEVAPLLLQARTVEPGAHRRQVVPGDEPDEVAKRRRNGRLLTATGLALLAGLGGYFLLPGNGDDGDTPLDQDGVTTVTVTVPVPTAPLLPELPAIPAEEVTTVPTAPPETTATTKKPTTATTKKPSTPGTTATTQPQTTSSLAQPGPPINNTTTTQVITTTSTTDPPIDPPVDL